MLGQLQGFCKLRGRVEVPASAAGDELEAFPGMTVDQDVGEPMDVDFRPRTAYQRRVCLRLRAGKDQSLSQPQKMLW